MKKTIRLAVTLLFLGIVNFPKVGYLYALAMLVAGGLVVFTADPPALAVVILAWGWKVYLACAALTLFVMLTFHFQNCCIGFNSFSQHLRNCGLRRHLDTLMVSLLWPHGWNIVAANMAGWGMFWVDIVYNAFEYWFYSRWRGVRVETITDVEGWLNGRVKPQVTYAKSRKGLLATVLCRLSMKVLKVK